MHLRLGFVLIVWSCLAGLSTQVLESAAAVDSCPKDLLPLLSCICWPRIEYMASRLVWIVWSAIRGDLEISLQFLRLNEAAKRSLLFVLQLLEKTSIFVSKFHPSSISLRKNQQTSQNSDSIVQNYPLSSPQSTRFNTCQSTKPLSPILK